MLRARLNHLAGRLPGARFFTRGHALVFRLSGGRFAARWSGVPLIVLVTTGRRSGRRRAAPVVHLAAEDRLIVLPAAAGAARTPAWWLNLQANPRATAILAGGERRAVLARRAGEAEQRELWRRFAAVYPDIEEFRSFTSRELPLVVLEPDRERRVGGSRSSELGESRTVTLRKGEIHYRERGHGPALLLVHGLWVNGDLWRKVVPALADSYRCVVPDWPFGAHARALAADADLTPGGIADLIAAFIDALGLDDVTVIANDTGIAFTQVFVARHPDKLRRLVLTPGDVGWNFLPVGIKWMRPVSAIPGAIAPLARFWNTRLGRWAIMLPLARQRPPGEILDSWFMPATRDRGLRRDLAKLLRAASPRATLSATRQLDRFNGPSLIAWTATDNVVFPLRHARLLQRVLPGARLELIPASRVFIPEDQPEQLADAIRRFVPARSQLTHSRVAAPATRGVR